MASNQEFDRLAASSMRVGEMSSQSGDDIVVSANLVPDNNDMDPRSIGTRDMPFRDVCASTLRGCVEANESHDSIGYNYPFYGVYAQHLHASTLNDVPIANLTGGYGWFWLHVSNASGRADVRVIRSALTKSAFAIEPSGADEAALLVHPAAPYQAFDPQTGVLAEITRLDGAQNAVALDSSTIFMRLAVEFNPKLGTHEIRIPFKVQTCVSENYDALIKLY